MQMIHRLPPVRTAVDHNPVTVCQAEFDRQVLRRHEQMPEQHSIAIGGVGKRRDLDLRNHEHVRRRLGIHVAERQAAIVLMNDARRNFLVDDPFEDGFDGHADSLKKR